jgi:hypothetical protein
MKYVLLLFVVALWVSAGIGQWNQVTLLTDDNHFHHWPQIVVDDSLRLHVFDVRSLTETSEQPASLFYQRFDNWGNSLGLPLELLPDPNILTDFTPGVFLDRMQNVHVVWGRGYDPPHGPDSAFFYARLSANGAILTGPQWIYPQDIPQFYIQSDINMVQSVSGDIWVACDSWVMAVSESGDVVVPLRPILEPYYRAVQAILGSHPDGSVWACVRYLGSNEQNISVVRVDVPGLLPEVVSPGNGYLVQMTPEAFFVDSTGVFHYVVFRDDAGLLYQRDARDGSPADTIVFDPSPYGVGSTFFTLVGRDTLEYIWGQTLPIQGFLRVGFRLAGGYAFQPIVVPQRDFSISSTSCFHWKRGSYWMAGVTTGHVSLRPQVGIIHVPGPNEPPNATEFRPRFIPDSPRLSVYPNPLNPTGVIVMELARRGVVNVEVFDVLGRRAANLANGVFEAGHYELQFDGRELPTGIYFVQMQTSGQMVTRKAVVVK